MKISETIRIAPPPTGKVPNWNRRGEALKGYPHADGCGVGWTPGVGDEANCFECGWREPAFDQPHAQELVDAHECRAESRDEARAAVASALATTA